MTIFIIIILAIIGAFFYLFSIASDKKGLAELSEKVHNFEKELEESGKLDEIKKLSDKLGNTIKEADREYFSPAKDSLKNKWTKFLRSEPILSNEIKGPVSLYKDNGSLLSTEEWNRAIDFIISQYSESVFQNIWKMMQEEGSNWFLKMNNDFSVSVKDKMQEADFDWGPVSLDNNWIRLVEDATKRVAA